MKYDVIRGTARHKGALYRKGSSFDAEAEDPDVLKLIRKGIIDPVKPLKKPKASDES